MEMFRQMESRPDRIGAPPVNRPVNDNAELPLTLGRSTFPKDAVARIRRRCRSAMTSGKARAGGWTLGFEPRSPHYVEPLMGWTGCDDTLPQVELDFPTLASAVRYAERQGLAYIVEGAADRDETSAPHAFSDATLKKLGLAHLQGAYGKALEDAADRPARSEAASSASPTRVLDDPVLTIDEKRSILMNWAYHEYLIDQATSEGMPENNRPSRLHEVEQALLELERAAAAGNGATRKAA